MIAQSPDDARTIPTLPFVDQGARDASFSAFRKQLLGIIDRHDVPALLEAVHPEIKNTFGDDNGIEAFRRLRRPNAKNTSLWKELRSVLTLGGTFEGPGVFVAPYVFSTWPSDRDALEHMALIGDGVRVRAAPRANARVLTVLSRAILGPGAAAADVGWTSVALPDGRTGFVSSDLVRDPIDYRAYFVRSNGRWQMTVFIAGD